MEAVPADGSKASDPFEIPVISSNDGGKTHVATGLPPIPVNPGPLPSDPIEPKAKGNPFLVVGEKTPEFKGVNAQPLRSAVRR